MPLPRTCLLHDCLTDPFSPGSPLPYSVSPLSPSPLPPFLLPHSSLPPPSSGQVSATYERCCVLFNIGALQSQIGKSQNFDSDDGLKNAAKYFQVVSHTLHYVTKVMPVELLL